MNLEHARVVLRPRGTLQVADLAVQLVRSDPGPFLRLAGVLLLPAWVIAVALSAWWRPWVGTAWLLLFGAFLQAPFVWLASRSLFQRGVRLGDLWAERAAVLRTGSFAMLVQSPAWLAGLPALALIPLGPWMALQVVPLLAGLFLQLLIEVHLLEGQGVSASLWRTLEVDSDHGGRRLVSYGGQLLAMVWFVVAFEAAGQAVAGFVFQLGAPFGSLWEGDETPYALAGLVGFQGAVAVYRVLEYVDVRTTREGWDVQVALRAARGSR